MDFNIDKLNHLFLVLHLHWGILPIIFLLIHSQIKLKRRHIKAMFINKWFNENDDTRSIRPPQGLSNKGEIPDGFSKEVSYEDKLQGIEELQRKDDDI